MRHLAADDIVTELSIQRSRFIAALATATDEETARAHIERRRKLHPKATHHCTAYILGPDGATRRGNDDGEPSGTAANPMLEALRHHQLTDTVAVVTRYFGGTKLGTGGLARAYSGAVTAAIDDAGTIDVIPTTSLTITIDHHAGGSLENDLRAHHITIDDIRYDQRIHIDVTVPRDTVDDTIAWLSAHTAGAATITQL